MENILQGDSLTLGTCYYPEHWPKDMWQSDLQRMKENGIEVIRIAEFAWSKVEPREGEFTFAFFDDFLEVAKKEEMKVIFCTPTATPPAWLTHKYPEVLNATMEGVKYRHGARRHYNYNSAKYQELTKIIVEKFASHYASHPNIIGWQIDNEINCELNNFYSQSDTFAFRAFLKEKYQNLDRLNEAWGTSFWNQMYTEWEEIYVPQKTVSDSTNPHRVLDYYRFVSASARKYVKLQADILKKYVKANDFITTNGMFGHLDNHKMNAESLDFYTYDSYPNFGYALDMYDPDAEALRDRWWSRNLMETRSISSRFGIMEQQSGPNGWNTRMEASAPRPGQLTLWTMQSVAHGADFISYFRWRTCTMGTEIYWHGILDYSNRDNRRLREVKDVNEKMQAIRELAGSVYEAHVGIVKDYDNIWDSELDIWHQHVEKASQKALFEAGQLSHTPMDYVYLQENTCLDNLKPYKVLFYPHATILTKERMELLQEYVSQGGVLVFGCRTGYKDLSGQCTMEKLPGLARNLTGADVYEYTLIAPDSEEVTVEWDGEHLDAAVFLDLVESLSDSGKLEGQYKTGDYPGAGALVSNSYGQGRVYYYGTAFTKKSAQVFLEKLQVISPLAKEVTVASTCEIAVRKKEEARYIFILNYKKEKAQVTFHDSVINLYTGENIQGQIELDAYETLVVKK